MEKIIGGNMPQGQPGPSGQGGAPNLNINLAEAPYMTCEKCENDVFEEKMKIKKVSRFMTGGAQDSIVPIPVIVCSNCGNINEMFQPKV